MFRFLSAEALYGLLLVTTFASVGLLGLWAATSRWHPFLRTTIALAILSVLLLRPMYEPFVMLVSQVATIAAGVGVYRWVKNRKQANTADAKRTRYQFSLKTLLFVSTLMAMGAAVVAKLPELGWRIWLGYVGVGIAAGLGMLGVALLVAPTVKWWIRLIGFLGAILFGSLAFAPLQVAYENYTDPNHVFGRSSAFLVFSCVVVATLVLGLTCGTWKLGKILEERKHPPVATKFFSFIAFALWITLAFLPTYVAWRLLNPLPPLARNTTTPNSFHELAKLGNKFDRSPLITAYNADPVVMPLLASEVANHQVDYEQLDRLLKIPCIVPDPMNGQQRYLLEWRSLAYATVARADVARDRGQLDAALSANEHTLKIARGFRGGLFNDYYLGLVIEGLGIYSIFESRTDLNAMQCQRAIDALRFHDENREPLGDIILRDQHWVENSDGWLRHLFSLLLELVDDSVRNRHISIGEEALHFKRALLRLTMTELALRKYQLTHNSLPDKLDQLVPEILPEVPRDPFDLAGGNLRYKRTSDGYILYSVCKNGIDDGGIPPNEEGTTPADWFQWWSDEHGDLRLDHFFAEPEPETPEAEAELDEFDIDELN